ncbi:DDE-type integrase/transposase/recombinase [Klebsiella pneumoniae]|uniref:DDE-type integrase/transposase/recombinase n=1 Tax=Klebsiella pneumoniae TaxID=573 RepID=UPI0040556E50
MHLDFAGPFKGKILLLVVDAFSKWIEVFVVHEMTTETIIYLLKAQLITRFGLPRTIITDNQTTFTSSKFQQFCANFGIKHILTPSYHPQSNGQVERYVQTTKQSLRKLMETGKNFNQELCNFLFQFRSTPTAAGVSPAELFLRRCKFPLPGVVERVGGEAE